MKSTEIATDIQIKTIYKWIKSIYPLKKNLLPISDVDSLADIFSLKLSHFTILNGVLINKIINSENISHVKIPLVKDWITINEYLRLLCRNIEHKYLIFFVENPYKIPKCTLPGLEIEKIKTHSNHELNPNYINTGLDNIKLNKTQKIRTTPNHFVFPSLDISSDESNIAIVSKELRRLVKTRDNYKTLHFHLNKGGDTAVAVIILMCLCGKKESWMKNETLYDIKRYHEDDTTHKITLMPQEYDPWCPWERDSIYYDLFCQIFINDKGINEYRSYDKKYNGKIILHLNLNCSSATWYLITYIIYAFSSDIKRQTINVNGVPIKVGKINSNSLTIHGYSLTSSGDAFGETEDTNKEFTIGTKKFTLRAPTIETITSVKDIDYNRFWLPSIFEQKTRKK